MNTFEFIITITLYLLVVWYLFTGTILFIFSIFIKSFRPNKKNKKKYIEYIVFCIPWLTIFGIYYYICEFIKYIKVKLIKEWTCK